MLQKTVQRPICTPAWLQLVLLALAHCWPCQIWSGYWVPIDCSSAKFWGLFNLGTGLQQEMQSHIQYCLCANIPCFRAWCRSSGWMESSHVWQDANWPGVTACVQCQDSFWLDLAVLTKLNPVSLRSTGAACRLSIPGPCQLPNHALALLGRVFPGLHKIMAGVIPTIFWWSSCSKCWLSLIYKYRHS